MNLGIDYVILILRAKWKEFLLLNIIVLTCGFFYIKNLDNIYISQAILAPNNYDSSEPASLSSSLSGLSSLAGFNLPKTLVSSTDKGIQLLKSLDFFSYIQEKKDIKPLLFAVKSWNPRSNLLAYDESLYDVRNNEWIRRVSFPKRVIPSDQEAYKEFLNNFNVNRDKSSGLIILTYAHKSPYVAQEILLTVIKSINTMIKEKERDRLLRSIDYLNLKLLERSPVEIRDALSRLIESQTKSLMLLEVDSEYFLKTIDSPVVPEEKYLPNRKNMMLLLLMVSFLFNGIILVVANVIIGRQPK